MIYFLLNGISFSYTELLIDLCNALFVKCFVVYRFELKQMDFGLRKIEFHKSGEGELQSRNHSGSRFVKS